jgi:hypothetical protein
MTRNQSLTALDALLRPFKRTTHGTTTKASGGESSLALSGAGHAENQAHKNIPHYIEIADAIEADRKEREALSLAQFNEDT